MVENLTTSAVLKDKLGHVASDLLHKIDHTVQNLGKNRPTEESPLNYKVTHKGGALVRSGYETTSSQVHQLAAGEVVTIVELVGRRARIIAPVEGWVSTETKDGVQIMRPCTVQRRSVQNEAFEHMFEAKFNRLKAQSQRGGGSSNDPRCQPERREPSDSPRDRSGYDRYDRRRDYDDDDRDYRDDRDRRDRDDRDRRDADGRDARVGDRAATSSAAGQSGSNAGFIPRLSAPGSKGGPTVLAPPPGQASGSVRPAGGSAPASAADPFDLLGFGDSAPAAAPAAAAPKAAFASTPAPVAGTSSSNLLDDMFGDAPTTASAAVPSASSAASPFDAFQPAGASTSATAVGGDDWAGFQNSSGASRPAQGNMGGGCMGGSPFGAFGQPSQPAATGMQAMGWNAPAPAMQGAGGGYAGGCGGCGMGAGAGMGGFQAFAAPQAATPGWAPFGGSAPCGGMGMPAAAQPKANAGYVGGGGCTGFTMPGMHAPPAAGGVDDLMNKAMQGMGNLSLKPSSPQSGTSAPMGMGMGMR